MSLERAMATSRSLKPCALMRAISVSSVCTAKMARLILLQNLKSKLGTRWPPCSLKPCALMRAIYVSSVCKQKSIVMLSSTCRAHYCDHTLAEACPLMLANSVSSVSVQETLRNASVNLSIRCQPLHIITAAR